MAGIPGRGGKKGRSGRKPKLQDEDAKRLLDHAWPVEERIRVVESLNKRAIEGDTKAAALLLAYTYGKPKETIEHEGELTHKIVRVPNKAQSVEEWEQGQSNS